MENKIPIFYLKIIKYKNNYRQKGKMETQKYHL
jgi:hypothetical protein